MEGIGRGLSTYYPDILPGGLRKTMKFYRQNNICTGRDLNQVPPEYISSILPMHSARFLEFCLTELCSYLSFFCCCVCPISCLYRPPWCEVYTVTVTL
jgi:hypothetical protein